MTYMNEIELNLPADFCQNVFNECTASIESSTSFNLIGLPSVGISFFMRFLSSHSKYKFVHVNTYEMPEFTKEEFFKQFARKVSGKNGNKDYLLKCREGLEELAHQNSHVVIVINRIDRLASIMDQNFFDNLRYLRDTNRKKIIFIFISSTPLHELDKHLSQSAFAMQTKQIFFKTYSKQDLLALSMIDGTPLVKDKALELCGGHHSLFQTLLRCQSLDNPLSDQMVELVIKEIYLSQNAKRRDQLEALALRKKVDNLDYLIELGLVRKKGNKYEFFSELLEKYLLHSVRAELPVKEKRLLKILLKNQGKIVSKQDIFDYVWGDEIASDWSLNSLVYRLRRNPGFDSNRYSIKSVKKDGYELIDSFKNI